MKLLLAEDDAILADALSSSLAKAGFEVEVLRVAARIGSGVRHVIFLGTRRGVGAQRHARKSG